MRREREREEQEWWACSKTTLLWRMNPPGSLSTWGFGNWLFFFSMGTVCWTGQGRLGKDKGWNPSLSTQETVLALVMQCAFLACQTWIKRQTRHFSLFFFVLPPSCLPTTSPNPENTLKLTPIPMAYLGGQRGMNCPELEGLLLEERTVRCRVCGELGLQSATRMTQKLNIASDINRASHRANTGPPSPSTDSHEH